MHQHSHVNRKTTVSKVLNWKKWNYKPEVSKKLVKAIAKEEIGIDLLPKSINESLDCFQDCKLEATYAFLKYKRAKVGTFARKCE